ncbi:MAG: hypothetical protein FJ280_25305 [Planctomycetes bacterium]|nr:hypothetical protein [Planctomycetota bacterium]
MKQRSGFLFRAALGPAAVTAMIMSVIVCMVGIAYPDQQAITRDKKLVTLHDDGTWEYASAATPAEETYAQMSAEEFRATKPTTPILMRVWGKLDDYYNYEFGTADKVAWSIRVSDYKGSALGHGYLKKDTDAGKQVFNILRDGKEHKMVVEINCLPRAENGSVFVISSVKALDRWK